MEIEDTSLYRSEALLWRSDTYIVFQVRCCSDTNSEEVIVMARHREHAKRLAKRVLKNDSEKYVVEPLTKCGTPIIWEP